MTVRVASRFAHEAVSAPCARCLTLVDVAAGQWHATESGDLDGVVCDGCAADGDPHGFSQLLGWRRAASGSTRSAAT